MPEPVPAPATNSSLSMQRAHERELIDQIRQKDRHGDFRSCLVVEVLRPGKQTVIHFANPYLEQPGVVSIQTSRSREEVERIAQKIIPTREACDMMSFLAECYAMRLPALIEGPTALGKTYLIKKFNELLYGEGVAPLDFYCSGQTDVAELMARWVPKTSNKREQDLWQQFLRSEDGQKRLDAVVVEQNSQSGEVAHEVTIAALRRLAEEVGLSGKTQWELQLGAVPKAMLGSHDAKGEFSYSEDNPIGCILHVEEVGLARPAVVNALLKVRGELGQVCQEIELWEDGGRRIKAGSKFWFVMSTNPPEDYGAREPVDQALARGLVFRRYPSVDKSSYLMVARRYFGFEMGNRPKEPPPRCILPIYRHPELCAEVADFMAEFHACCVDQCRGGESGRAQRIPVTFDDMARVASFLLTCQVRDHATGGFDVVETLRRSVERMYLGRLLPEERVERGVNVLQEAGARPSGGQGLTLRAKLTALFEQLLVGETGIKTFEQKKLKRAEIFKVLVGRAHDAEERQRFGRDLSPEEELEFRRERLRSEAGHQIGIVEQLIARRTPSHETHGGRTSQSA